MANTCVLSILPDIPNWKIYNFPSKKNLEYYWIYKQKRLFQNLIENVLHGNNPKYKKCFIVDKHIYSTKISKTMEIIFLNKIEMSCLLSLNLSVSEKYVARRQNNILVFLKNTGKDINFQIQNNSIFINCSIEIQWELFYKLFEFLLLKYNISIIGPVFYNSLISGYMLAKEKLFLQLITIKQEIVSQSNLLMKNLNYNQNILKKPLPNLNCNEVYFEETCVMLSSQNFECRKSIKRTLKCDSLNNHILPDHKIRKKNPCNCEIKNCTCHEAGWTFFRNIKKCIINNYTGLLLLKGIVPDTETFSQESLDQYLSDQPSVLPKSGLPPNDNENIELSDISDQLLSKSKDKAIPVDGISDQALNKSTVIPVEISNSSELLKMSKNNVNFVQEENADMMVDDSFCEKEDKSIAEIKPVINVLSNHQKGKENTSLQFTEFHNESQNKFNTLASFQTASGKKVNISETALKAAEKMFGEIFQSDQVDSCENQKPKAAEPVRKCNFQNPISALTCKTNSVSSLTNNYTGEQIDGTLAEKMFEEISFDEKELECFASSSSVMENTSSRASGGKIRKSLGGRRSLKPYSVPKL